jgi:manganese/zinc-transporting P-type ATPase C
MVMRGFALVLLGLRCYVCARPPLFGPTRRLFATVATIITEYPFLGGALTSLRDGRFAATDLLVAAATIASLVLRENVVASTVLRLLNIGEYLQGLTLRRTRRAVADLLTGNQDAV